MKLIIFICIFVVAVHAFPFKERENQFQKFKLKFSKTYKNQAEERKHFNTFIDNLHTIEEHNALYKQGDKSYRQGINRFTDMTREELKSMFTLKSINGRYLNSSKHVKTGIIIPNSIDWRTKGQVTEIKDQGICGSCWAFSITGSTEAAYYRKSGNLVSFSEQQLIDCSVGINFGCSGGFLEQTFPYIQKYGLESEGDYPFIAIDASCNFSASKVVTKILDYTIIEPNDEDALLDAVANVGPVSVGMDATFLTNYESGIFEEWRCSKEQLGHAVLIVGYGRENDTDYWLVKNSWGSKWGEQGYFRIKRGCNECGIAKDTVYPKCI